MFQFRRFPAYAYLIQRTLSEYCSDGFPHSEILGSTPMCGSPRLIAACHVLHRLLMPRHSPCALSSLTFRKTVSGSTFDLELCRPQRFFGFLCCVTLLFKAPQKILPSLLLALYIWNFFLIVQFSRCRPLVSLETRYKHSIPLNTCIRSQWWR